MQVVGYVSLYRNAYDEETGEEWVEPADLHENADAALICAAPDLLEALNQCVDALCDQVESCPSDVCSDTEPCSFCRDAQAAISKAAAAIAKADAKHETQKETR